MYARLPYIPSSLAFTILLATCIASTVANVHNVFAFSSASHFLCGEGNPSKGGLCEGDAIGKPLPARAPADLVGALAGKSAGSALPEVAARIAPAVSAPQVVLSVTSHVADSPSNLASRMSEIFTGESGRKSASSFVGTVDGSLSAVDATSSVGRAVSVAQLSDLSKSDRSTTGKAEVMSVTVDDAVERDALFAAIRSLVDGTDGHVAVVWASVRDEVAVQKEEEKARESAQKGAASGAAAADAVEASAEKKGVTTSPPTSTIADAGANSTKKPVMPGFAADGTLLKTTSMNPPELSTAGLMGLLVGLVFLIILAPGLLCLYNIEAPYAFDHMDKDEANKKMKNQ